MVEQRSMRRCAGALQGTKMDGIENGIFLSACEQMHLQGERGEPGD